MVGPVCVLGWGVWDRDGRVVGVTCVCGLRQFVGWGRELRVVWVLVV